MMENNPYYRLQIISRTEYNSRFHERIPTPALVQGADYTLALLFKGTDPEALTILSTIQFRKRAKGALAISLYFTDRGPCPGTILDDGIWLPDSEQPLRFNTVEGEQRHALQGYFMPYEPDTGALGLTDFVELTEYLSQ